VPFFGISENRGMNYQKGQVVTVTDYRRRKHERVVWSDNGRTVSITSEANLVALEQGNRSVPPIAVAKETVSRRK
jgi:hypothetical protein